MTGLITFLNTLANGCARYLLAPIAVLPGWLSATLIAVVTGLFMLLVFKYTSNQESVKKVRNGIKANLLALSLFKDSIAVSLRCQTRVLAGAGRLLLLAVVPMLVMTVPACLLLAQLALWYQARPLRVGEEAVLTLHLADQSGEMPEVFLNPTSGAETTIGPVRVADQAMVCWNLRGERAGRSQFDSRRGREEGDQRACRGRRLHAGQPPASSVEFQRSPVPSTRAPLPPGIRRAVCRDRLSDPRRLDERQRRMALLLVRRLHDRSLLRATVAESQSLIVFSRKAAGPLPCPILLSEFPHES